MRTIFSLLLTCCFFASRTQQLFEMPANSTSGWSSFENLNGARGAGGKSNQTAKGHAFENLLPGETKTLLNLAGAGSIRRIWMTIDQTPVKLRSLRLQMFWDGAAKAAVDVPMGDFFGYNLGHRIAFQSALFSSGEGRSFNCYIPMPFREGARIIITNDGKDTAKLFYDVDFVKGTVPANALYFHAFWARDRSAKLGTDFVLLPGVRGRGRFLGVTVGLNTDSVYSNSWWGEGEMKMYLDGDGKYPTIVGSGSEDYIGSAWGLGTFTNLYQGCTVASDSLRQFNFYRWHIPDPIYFQKEIRVSLQQIGGWGRDELRGLVQKGVNLKPVTVDGPGGFVKLLEDASAPSLMDKDFPEGWVNFYRVDDYSAVSYFYLDKPTSSLPGLPGLSTRIFNVK